MIPKQDAVHTGFYLETLMQDFTACMLGKFEEFHSQLKQSPAFVCSVDSEVDAGTIKKRRPGRVAKFLGDLAWLASAEADALSFYLSAVEHARRTEDFLFWSLALECVSILRMMNITLPGGGGVESSGNGGGGGTGGSSGGGGGEETSDRFGEALALIARARVEVVEVEMHLRLIRLRRDSNSTGDCRVLIQRAISAAHSIPLEYKANALTEMSALAEALGYRRKAALLRYWNSAALAQDKDFVGAARALESALPSFGVIHDGPQGSHVQLGWSKLQAVVLFKYYQLCVQADYLDEARYAASLMLGYCTAYLTPDETTQVSAFLLGPVAMQGRLVAREQHVIKVFNVQACSPREEDALIPRVSTAQQGGIFIYSSIQSASTQELKGGAKTGRWVQGEKNVLEVSFYSKSKTPIYLSGLALLTPEDPGVLRVIPAIQKLAVTTEPLTLKWFVIPEKSGNFTICEVAFLTVESLVLESSSLSGWKPLQVTVVPEAPTLQIKTNIPNEMVVFDGQQVDCLVTVTNSGKLPVHWVACDWTADPLPGKERSLSGHRRGDMLSASAAPMTFHSIDPLVHNFGGTNFMAEYLPLLPGQSISVPVLLLPRQSQPAVTLWIKYGANAESTYLRRVATTLKFRVSPSIVFTGVDVVSHAVAGQAEAAAPQCLLVLDIHNATRRAFGVVHALNPGDDNDPAATGSEEIKIVEPKATVRFLCPVPRFPCTLLSNGQAIRQMLEDAKEQLSQSINFSWRSPYETVGRVFLDSLEFPIAVLRKMIMPPVSLQVSVDKGEAENPLPLPISCAVGIPLFFRCTLRQHAPLEGTYRLCAALSCGGVGYGEPVHDALAAIAGTSERTVTLSGGCSNSDGDGSSPTDMQETFVVKFLSGGTFTFLVGLYRSEDAQDEDDRQDGPWFSVPLCTWVEEP
jgi:hypothetical protein